MVLRTAVVLSLSTASLGQQVTPAHRAAMAAVRERLDLPACATAGPGGRIDAACGVARARKLVEHEAYLLEMAAEHAPAHVGLLRSLLAFPRYVVGGAAPGTSTSSSSSSSSGGAGGAAGSSRQLSSAMRVADPYFMYLNDTIDLANNTCEGRYGPVANKIAEAGLGCAKVDSTNAQAAPTPAPTDQPEDSCAPGSAIGDSMYNGYTCNYELQPLACKAQSDSLCRTHTPVTARDGNWAEKLFENNDCEAPWESGYAVAEHGPGGTEGCSGAWEPVMPERFRADIQSTELQCPVFAARAFAEGITADKATAVEACDAVFEREARRVDAGGDGGGGGVVVGLVVAVAVAAGLGGCFVQQRKKRRQQEQQQQQQQQPVSLAQQMPQLAGAVVAPQMDIQVPAGAMAGSQLQVAHPQTGQLLMVQVPPNVPAGGTFRVSLMPAAAAALPTATAVSLANTNAKMHL